MSSFLDRLLRTLSGRGGVLGKGVSAQPRLIDPFIYFADGSVWTRVESSNLESVAYLAGPNDYSRGGIMAIRFKSGSTYWYLDVGEGLFRGLLAAPSKGQYLDRNVKKAGVYYELKT